MSYQNHHIINQTLARSVLRETGLDIDKAAINRINLPSTRDGARALRLTRHHVWQEQGATAFQQAR